MHIRAVLPSRLNPLIADNHVPLESDYSNDVEKLGEDMEDIFQISKNILSEVSTSMKNSKFTRVYIEEVGTCDEWGNELRGNRIGEMRRSLVQSYDQSRMLI